MRGDLELCAVLRVLGPLTGQPERLAALHARQSTDDGDPVLGGFGRLRAQLGDGVMVLLVEEDDALEDAGQGDGSGSSHGGTQMHTEARRGNTGATGLKYPAIRRADDLKAGAKSNPAAEHGTAGREN